MGFPGLACIKCGEVDTVAMDLDDCSTFRCRECENEFTLEDVRASVTAWQRVLAWLDSVPCEVAGKVA